LLAEQKISFGVIYLLKAVKIKRMAKKTNLIHIAGKRRKRPGRHAKHQKKRRTNQGKPQ